MINIDLHVHSKYSAMSQDPIIKSFGVPESVTTPSEVYKQAKRRGMNMVTITDHDTIEGALRLCEKHPTNTIMGVELTTYFPEDKSPIHLLTYGFTEADFKILDKLRHNIYETRDYIKQKNLPHSVAHLTYRVEKDKLSVEQIEKIFVLFDVFEVINGCHNKYANESLERILSNLDKEKMDKLIDKHNLEPFSDKYWEKGRTAGTDDHAGIFIGTTYTSIESSNAKDLKGAIINKTTKAGGLSRDYKSYAFHIYKSIFDAMKAKQKGGSQALFSQISDAILLGKRYSFKNMIKIKGLKYLKKNKKKLERLASELLHESNIKLPIDDKLNVIYNQMRLISDEMFLTTINGVDGILNDGNLTSFVDSLPFALYSGVVHVPFSLALKYMYKDTAIIKEVENRFIPDKRKKKRILWFTDTFTDANSVAHEIHSISEYAYSKNYDLKIVTSILDDEKTYDLKPNIINLPTIYHTEAPFYKKFNIKIPSLLKTIETLYEYNPDEIYISTPGVIGLYGLIISKLCYVKTKMVYHSDIKKLTETLIGRNAMLVKIIDKYLRWFHRNVDQMLIHTEEYMSILKDEGYLKKHMREFSHFIELDKFKPNDEYKNTLKDNFKVKSGIKILYLGSISKYKNLDILIDSFLELSKKHKNVNLIFVGEGDYLEELQDKYKKKKNMYFFGSVLTETLPKLYNSADIFAYPSEIDAFGISILEAQACGLPAIVSRYGGPKTLIEDKKTGFIVNENSVDAWVNALDNAVNIINDTPEKYKNMRKNTRKIIEKKYNCDNMLSNIFEFKNRKENGEKEI